MENFNLEIPEIVPEIILTSNDAITPKKKKALGVGYDIYSPQTVVIPSKTKRLINTELKLRVPPHIQVKIDPISVSTYMESYVVNCDKKESDGSEKIMILVSNKIDQDFMIPKGTLLGRIVYSIIVDQEQYVVRPIPIT